MNLLLLNLLHFLPSLFCHVLFNIECFHYISSQLVCFSYISVYYHIYFPRFFLCVSLNLPRTFYVNVNSMFKNYYTYFMHSFNNFLLKELFLHFFLHLPPFFNRFSVLYHIYFAIHY